jgi:pilus assembly protein Flp/PilA
MQTTWWNLCSRLRNLFLQEEGQDLVEYAMVFAVIALATIASMQSVAGGLSLRYHRRHVQQCHSLIQRRSVCLYRPIGHNGPIDLT